MIRPARLVAACAAAIVVLAFAGPTRVEAKSFDIDSLVTTASVAADGSMSVTESWTYDFEGGPFNFGIRPFAAADRARVMDFTATDADGSELPVIPPHDSVSGEWEWELGTVSDSTETYVLSYTIPGAISLGTDVGELYWQFLGSDHPGTDDVSITIEVPGTFVVADESTPPTDATVLRAWAHGPPNGNVAVNPSTVVLTVADVPAGRFVEARVAVPATAFTDTPVSGPRLPTILEEEANYIDESAQDGDDDDHTAGNVLAPVLALAGFAGIGATWARFGREPKPDPMIGEYWREPLDDPPAVVLANQRKGDAPLGNSIGSTLIDLAQRGYVRIAEEREERFGPDTVVHRLRWGGKPATELAPFEQNLVQHVFLGKSETTLDDVQDWAKANRTQGQAFAKSFTKQVKTEFDARAYRARTNPTATAWLIGIASAVAIGGFVSSRLDGQLALIAYIAAAVCFVVGSILVVNRTKRGADEKAKADSLRNFLRDFSNLEEAPAGHLILWERFLVYAVTLGVADELLDGLRVRLPAVAEDPSFGAWYSGPGGSLTRLAAMNHFAHAFGTSSAAAFAPPSKSGGGGGFSGGGGGGGGGGGIGAR